MKLSESVKSISYLKTHTSEVVRDAVRNGKTYVITQRGEAKVVVQDIKEFEKIQEKMAMLKIIAMSEEEVKRGKVTPLKKAFKELDIKIAKLKKEWNIR